ncbi:unnamed protein product [Rhizoctonia solani]|uniref:Uncharacterized protein n=1 Tax=Rhizoctonia solani TaxID=456999 RepID=A0A8H3CFJ8_9AGAM|nr:unnamed protein product [Rhizoctonia solani]
MFKFAAASLFAFVALVVAQNDPSINTPASVVQCQPVQLSWTASKEPVYVSIIPGGQPGAAPLHDFGIQPSGTKTMTWTCDLKAGSAITFQIKDATGAVAYTGNMMVQDSKDKSCVDPNMTVPAAPSSAQSTPLAQSTPGSSAPAATPPAGTSAAGTTPAGSATRPAASNGTSRAPATATSAAPGSTAAASNAAPPATHIGWTGLVGILAAFIVA